MPGKRYLITALYLVIYISCFSQVHRDPFSDKFVGTWQWTSGTDTLTVILEKQTDTSMPAKHNEVIAGWYRYVKNGRQKVSNLEYAGTSVTTDFLNDDEKTYMFGGSHGPNRLELYVPDMLIEKTEILTLTMLPGSTTQATWELSEGRCFYLGPQGTIGKMTLPRNLVVTKQ